MLCGCCWVWCVLLLCGLWLWIVRLFCGLIWLVLLSLAVCLGLLPTALLTLRWMMVSSFGWLVSVRGCVKLSGGCRVSDLSDADRVELAAASGAASLCRRVHHLTGQSGEVRCDCGREWSVVRPALSSLCGGCGLVVLVRWF